MRLPETKEGRLFFPFLSLGLIVLIAGLVSNFRYMTFDSFFSDLWDFFFVDQAHGRWHFYAARGGATAAIIGYVLSYHWNSTAGRFIRWVRSGQ